MHFIVPNDWNVVEDDLNEVIRAITLETPLDGFCMLDLYKLEQAPTLDGYIDNQMECFLEALPFGFRMVDGPNKSRERARHEGREVFGVTVKSIIRSLFLRRHSDANSFFRIESDGYVGMCSLRCSGDSFLALRPGFLQLLESFRAEQPWQGLS
ncbi:MAG TPA: hypothetical protein VNM68_11415 [Candidatus Polarisedimenticolia bacterium]|nr:hypothetical protein [Candidatus Polarisedimenticolia bacterium]